MIRGVKKFCEKKFLNNIQEKNIHKIEILKIINTKDEEINRLKYRIKILLNTIDNLENKKFN